MQTEQIYDKILSEVGHHPLQSSDIIPVLELLRGLGIRDNNTVIMEGYNASERIKGAYRILESRRKSDEISKRRNSQDLKGVKSGKLVRHKSSDSSIEGNEGGV